MLSGGSAQQTASSAPRKQRGPHLRIALCDQCSVPFGQGGGGDMGIKWILRVSRCIREGLKLTKGRRSNAQHIEGHMCMSPMRERETPWGSLAVVPFFRLGDASSSEKRGYISSAPPGPSPAMSLLQLWKLPVLKFLADFDIMTSDQRSGLPGLPLDSDGPTRPPEGQGGYRDGCWLRIGSPGSAPAEHRWETHLFSGPHLETGTKLDAGPRPSL